MKPKDIVSTLKPIVFASLLLLNFCCTTSAKVKSIYSCSCESNIISKVNLKDVIRKPVDYDNKLIEVEGVFRGGFEQSAIYDKNGKTQNKNGVWIYFDDADSLKNETTGMYFLAAPMDTQQIIFNKKIIIRGLFDCKSKGHLSEYAGTLRRICYLETL